MTDAVNPIPERYHRINCFAVVPDTNSAIEYYRAVFGAEVLSRNDLPNGQATHTEPKVGVSTFQLGMPTPMKDVQVPAADWVHTSVV
ncbi:VOC family protein [Nocardia macrotermitis]|uniref:Uncharacterized protein n=1 Tax=Nocardia macrotermitis TaxID=2585198 RepID=A0A7K0D8F6_9NOCA|nr:hypothetical protein [Nocardia macrotermitis]MQY21154.1 hypothetical protein [Nocardia macrotermitis]